MKLKRSRKRDDKTAVVPAVEVSILKASLPLFWKQRGSIWDIPKEIGPYYLAILKSMKAIGAPVAAKGYSAAILELECMLSEIEAVDPEGNSTAIFARLWWLADYLDGSPLDSVSDMLVSSGRTSPTWEIVLQVAATLPATEDDLSFDRDAFSQAMNTLTP